MKILKKKLAKQIVLMLATGMIMTAPQAQALPSQGTLDNSAAATITTDMANDTMNIAGKGQNNIINWAAFNIDKGETVNFADKNNYLNLVHGVDMSRIYGTISGGNAVYLVNPNGILFAEGATLDNVGGFIASTRNISSINKEAFLNDPTNAQAVLGVDNPVMDNKDYYPEGSKYVPKITMADIKLTNVPESATLILDGPGGVILKSTDLLDKTTQLITRKNGGEIGIGSENGAVDSSTLQSTKIALVEGDHYEKFDTKYDVVKGYKWIRNWKELKDYSNINCNKILVNEINIDEFYPINSFRGVLNGLGHSVKGINFKTTFSAIESYGEMGLFQKVYDGTIENINFKDINIHYDGYGNEATIGGLAATVIGKGVFSNINIDGKITITNDDSEYLIVGGFLGTVKHDPSYIINSISDIDILVERKCRCGWWGNFAYRTDSNDDKIGGFIGDGSGTGSINIIHSTNKGDISRIQKWHNSSSSKIGGLAGTLSGGSIIGCENWGNIKFSTYNDTDKFIEPYSIGGIVGYSSTKNIKESYSLGNIEWSNQSRAVFDIEPDMIFIGGITGYNKDIITDNKNYYIQNNMPNDSRITTSKFGTTLRADELLLNYNRHDMIGVHDFSVQHSWPPTPPSGGNTGGGTTNPPSGGDTGGGTTNPPSGGNTGGGTTNPPSSGNTGSGTTNPPSGGNTGSGTTNPPNSGNNAVNDKEYNNTLSGIISNKKDNEPSVWQKIESGILTPKNAFDDIKNEYENKKDELINSILHYLVDGSSDIDKNNKNNGDKTKDTAWIAIKKNISQIGIKVSDDVLMKIMEPFTEKIEETVIKNIEVGDDNNKGDYKVTQQLLEKIYTGMSNIKDRTIKAGDTNYQVKYLMSNAIAGEGNLAADVTWTDEAGKIHTTKVTFTNINTPDGKQNLIDFTTGGLSNLAKDVTKNAAKDLLYSGLKDIIDKEEFDNGIKLVEKITNALVDENAAKSLIASYCKNEINSVEGKATSKIESMIKLVPGGDKIISSVKAYKEVTEAYVKYKNESNRFIKNENEINQAFSRYEAAVAAFEKINKL